MSAVMTVAAVGRGIYKNRHKAKKIIKGELINEEEKEETYSINEEALKEAKEVFGIKEADNKLKKQKTKKQKNTTIEEIKNEA